jgi:glutamate-1-semialdehyde aminotransferase
MPDPNTVQPAQRPELNDHRSAGSGRQPARIERERLAALRRAEALEFERRTPRSRALRERAGAHLPLGVPMSWMAGLYRTAPIYIAGGRGASFLDVDGNAYLDFNVCDLSMTVGYGNESVAAALAAQARRGAQFLLPTEDAIVVGELLAARMGLPYWQFTLSASGSNTEVIRIARFMTGRPRIVIFGGHYHGHLEETLVREEAGRAVPDSAGLSPGSASYTTILPFNDLAALERTLAAGDVALVLTEPAMTNCNVILPDAGFHEGLRALTRRFGTLLCIDEAHTLQFAFGGLTREWGLEPDFITLGKGFGSGVAFGLYGMSGPVAEVFVRHLDVDIGPRGIATGGTTYGSALAVAVARVMLEEVLTVAAYERVRALGARLADGLEAAFRQRALPWTAFRCGPRAGYCLAPTLPRTGAEGEASLDFELIDARRVFMANRGLWDAVAAAGPQASIAHTERDIDTYVGVAGEFLDRIVAG